jgi:DNA-binding transcriptional ArsR family regulator
MSEDQAIRQYEQLCQAVGGPLRARLLLRLLTTAGEDKEMHVGQIARLENLTLSAITQHVSILEAAGLISTRTQDRARIVKLRSKEVEAIVRMLFGFANGSIDPPSGLFATDQDRPEAWIVYDYLAGKLAIQIYRSFRRRGFLEGDSARKGLSESGLEFLERFGLDVKELDKARRAKALALLDPKTGELYFGGALGKMLLARLLELGWLERGNDSKAVKLIEKHRADFNRQFSANR